MDKYDETHRIISNMAGVKMQMNSHKGEMENVDPEILIKLLRKEVDELEEAIKERSMIHIIEESGDCMNFLVGIVHQQIQKYRTRKNKTPNALELEGPPV